MCAQSFCDYCAWWDATYVCEDCGRARYCTRECQRLDWWEHRATCGGSCTGMLGGCPPLLPVPPPGFESRPNGGAATGPRVPRQGNSRNSKVGGGVGNWTHEPESHGPIGRPSQACAVARSSAMPVASSIPVAPLARFDIPTGMPNTTKYKHNGGTTDMSSSSHAEAYSMDYNTSEEPPMFELAGTNGLHKELTSSAGDVTSHLNPQEDSLFVPMLLVANSEDPTKSAEDATTSGGTTNCHEGLNCSTASDGFSEESSVHKPVKTKRWCGKAANLDNFAVINPSPHEDSSEPTPSTATSSMSQDARTASVEYNDASTKQVSTTMRSVLPSAEVSTRGPRSRKLERAGCNYPCLANSTRHLRSQRTSLPHRDACWSAWQRSNNWDEWGDWEYDRWGSNQWTWDSGNNDKNSLQVNAVYMEDQRVAVGFGDMRNRSTVHQRTPWGARSRRSWVNYNDDAYGGPYRRGEGRGKLWYPDPEPPPEEPISRNRPPQPSRVVTADENIGDSNCQGQLSGNSTTTANDGVAKREPAVRSGGLLRLPKSVGDRFLLHITSYDLEVSRSLPADSNTSENRGALKSHEWHNPAGVRLAGANTGKPSRSGRKVRVHRESSATSSSRGSGLSLAEQVNCNLRAASADSNQEGSSVSSAEESVAAARIRHARSLQEHCKHDGEERRMLDLDVESSNSENASSNIELIEPYWEREEEGLAGGGN